MIPPFRCADVIVATTVAALTLVIALFFAPRGYQAGFVDMGHDGYQLRQVRDLKGGVIFRDTSSIRSAQRTGRYRLVPTNCIEGSPWRAASATGWGTFGLLTGGFMTNRFLISQFGWLR